MLHIDGHDTPAVAHAAAIARAHGIPVTVDVDTIYHGFDNVLPNIDYLVASSEFPTAWTGVERPVQRARNHPVRVRHARRRHDAGRARLARA